MVTDATLARDQIDDLGATIQFEAVKLVAGDKRAARRMRLVVARKLKMVPSVEGDAQLQRAMFMRLSLSAGHKLSGLLLKRANALNGAGIGVVGHDRR